MGSGAAEVRTGGEAGAKDGNAKFDVGERS